MSSHPTLRIGAPLSGEPHPVLQWIEVASFFQIPGFQVIGLPAREVGEARERVRAAIEASGLDFPRRRVVMNLSPASIRKHGTGSDLAMALAVLHDGYGLRKIDGGVLVAWGELSLDGTLKGAGQVARAVYAAWEGAADLLIVATEEYGLACEKLALLHQSGMLSGTPPRIAQARTLLEAWHLLQSVGSLQPIEPSRLDEPVRTEAIRRPEPSLLVLPRSMERIIGISAAGAHHLILLGPRGSGKSHALEWLIALQPEASPETQVRQSLLEELAGSTASPGHFQGPIRRVSPQTRPASLLGGATPAGVRPGAFSLAHGGLLIADEFPEWPRDSREALREPLERGVVTLTRARQSIELPARFTLAANGNLCPCGGWPPQLPLPLEAEGQRTARCRCPARARLLYLSRLSGPILDRLDLVMIAPHVGEGAKNGSAQERLRELRDQVEKTRTRLLVRWGAPPSHLTGADLERILRDQPQWQESLDPRQFGSLRARHKVLRVALTLSAWDGTDGPSRAHFSEASCYRPERFGLVD